LKFPEFPPVAIAVHVPPPELLLDEELLEDELELLELLLDEELLDEELDEFEPLEDELEELLDEDELLEDELELLLDEPPELPLIEPAEAVSVTRSSRAPSSRLEIRSV